MNRTNVFKIAKDIQENPEADYKQEIHEFVSSFDTEEMSKKEIVEKVIVPAIEMVDANNKIFTAELIQRVVDDLLGLS